MAVRITCTPEPVTAGTGLRPRGHVTSGVQPFFMLRPCAAIRYYGIPNRYLPHDFYRAPVRLASRELPETRIAAGEQSAHHHWPRRVDTGRGPSRPGIPCCLLRGLYPAFTLIPRWRDCRSRIWEQAFVCICVCVRACVRGCVYKCVRVCM